MNNFKKHQKIVMALMLVIAAIFAMAIPVFAETQEAEPSGWNDPMLYVFIAFVASFFALVIGAVVIYFAVKRRNKEKEWEESEGTIKLYEDLDDSKWDAPDTVYLDALEPTAAILLDTEPVRKIPGLDGIIITEHNPDPVQAINMGADPYAYKIGGTVTNTVFQDVENTVLEDNQLVVENDKPIHQTYTPKSSPLTHITSSPDFNNQENNYVSSGNVVYEDSVQRAVLEDAPIVHQPPKREEPVLPKSDPSVRLAKEVPITIVTSKDDDGVVEIKASVYENTVASVLLQDEPMAPITKTEPVFAAATPVAEPLSRSFVYPEAPVVIPAAEASIYESAEAAVMLADEIIPVAEEPIVVNEAATPISSPMAYTVADKETPVVIPGEEVAVYEDAISATVLEDEIIPVVEESVQIATADNSPSEPLTYIAVRDEELVEAPATEANVFEDTIRATVLEDVVIPVAEEPIAVTEATIPAASPIDGNVVNEETPVVIPGEEAAVYEDAISVTVLEDVKAAPIVEPVVIPTADNSPSEPLTYIAVRDEEPVEVPATEANVFEDTIRATVLEDVVIPVAEEPIAVTEATIPAASPIDGSVVAEDEPVIIPATEAMVFEDTINATVLEDEIIPVVETPVHISEATIPAASPIDGSVVAEEEPVIIPATEAMVFENTVNATVLEDEIIPVVETPVHISEATIPAASPIDGSVVAGEEPVIIPATEAMVFENTVNATVLEDEIIPVVEEPVQTSEATVPAASPISRTVVTEEEIIFTDGETVVYEDNISRSALEERKAEEAQARRTLVIDESVIEEPTFRNVFEAADEETKLSDKSVKEETLRDLDYIELSAIDEADGREKAEPGSVIKRTRTTIIEDDEVVLEVTEERVEKDAAYESVIIDDEPKEEEKPVRKSETKISTIPMTKNGQVKHEEPMIPTLPPISAKGVGRADTPFVLPATEEGKETMAKYADLMQKEEESSFKNALREAKDIPVAPMIDIDGTEPKEEPAPVAEPAPERPDVIVADADVEIIYNGDSKEPEVPAELPELIEEPEEEPTIEEPEEEPVVVPVEEPKEEPVPEEEPEIVPVFTDAEHADELMTDEEAEEHIEVVEEAPGEERKGKLHAINLDTICEAYEDGETVTLESLKEKGLAPKNSGRVKILARGTMTKKLEIIADSFSLQAVKMITLAGGRSEQYK